MTSVVMMTLSPAATWANSVWATAWLLALAEIA